MASLDSGTDNMIIYGCPPFVAAAKTLEPCIRIASFSAFMALIISSYARQLYSLSRLLFYVVTICPSAVHPVGCYYFTNSNNYQSSIPSEWNVDAECPRRYSKVFVYYNCVFTSTEKSNFVAVGNLVEGGTCITGKTVTILLSWKVFPSTPRISLFRPYCYFFAAERKSQLCSIYFITRVMLYNATPIAVQFRKPFRIYTRI